MHLKSVKTAADLPFKGIELIKVDNAISAVIIGGKLRIESGQYGGMKVLVEAPGESATRYRVKATLEGFPAATEYHETDWAAKESADAFTEKGAQVDRAKVDVLIDDAGVITETGASSAVSADLDLPF